MVWVCFRFLFLFVFSPSRDVVLSPEGTFAVRTPPSLYLSVISPCFAPPSTLQRANKNLCAGRAVPSTCACQICRDGGGSSRSTWMCPQHVDVPSTQQQKGAVGGRHGHGINYIPGWLLLPDLVALTQGLLCCTFLPHPWVRLGVLGSWICFSSAVGIC